jgi:hydrogenase maturation factor
MCLAIPYKVLEAKGIGATYLVVEHQLLVLECGKL